jgi:hypothetical protein
MFVFGTFTFAERALPTRVMSFLFMLGSEHRSTSLGLG